MIQIDGSGSSRSITEDEETEKVTPGGAEDVRVNLLAIVILSRGKCGLSQCISRYLLAMAVGDLLVVITDPILRRIRVIYFPDSSLSIVPVCSVIVTLSRAARDSSVWLTVAFTFDRFVAICCAKLKTKYCTERTAFIVMVTVCLLFSLKSIPWSFAYEPRYILKNVPWHCNLVSKYYTSLEWVAFDWIDTVLIPFVPFFVILLLNILTIRHILVTSKIRRRLRYSNSGDNHTDPEMENRRKSIILLCTVSGSFILLWTPYVINSVYFQVTGTFHIIYPDNPVYISRKLGYMLLLLSSCTNTCIYAVIQAKFREEVTNLVKYPFRLIGKLVKR
ncbi:probable G-protein coupled receptor 139 [Heptranchias perlo]|uniref:probable G-protein coupled receptor 139 n=1 Tax=Heptranchias perlo TaxID=212740 RepID=UPI003559DC29